MTHKKFQGTLISKVEQYLKTKIEGVEIPPQGMDSEVIFAKDNNSREYAIKYSKWAGNDVLALELLQKNKIDVPIPKLLGTFTHEDKTVVILEKINFPLLNSIPRDQMHRYIPAMIENLQIIHQVKSDQPGLLSEPRKYKTWKELMLAKFSGAGFNLNWEEISQREGLDGKLILEAVNNIVKQIESTDFLTNSFSLVHTDFNQKNLFVDPNSDQITGIVDWSEAMFGDPICDFARVRMFIWHFNLEKQILEVYDKMSSFTPEQKRLEMLYWLSWVIEYLAYYSEELNEFNVGRIKLHQGFLREYRGASYQII